MTPRLAVLSRPETATPLPAPAQAEDDLRLVSLVAPAPLGDPVRVFLEARRQGHDAVLWHLPARREALVGVGAVTTLTAAGDQRFSHVSRQWRTLAATALHFRVSETGLTEARDAAGPLLMGGFAFAPGRHQGPWTAFGDARMWVPRWVYQVAGDRAWAHGQTAVPGGEDKAAAGQVAKVQLDEVQAAVARALAGPDGRHNGAAGRGDALPAITRRDVPAKEEWLSAVRAVVEAIRAGEMEKAVLARAVQVTAPGGFALEPALRYLEEHYPDCYIFAIAQGDQCFLGATPERLVRLQDGQVEVACLAGSIARGRTPEEDGRLGDELLSSAKNRHEHQIVLDAILEGLAPLCATVDAAPAPTLLKFANVQHLYTPVRARLRNGATVLELAASLHPTPAIGGHPTERALAFISRLEAAGRGWYAGPVGWVDGRGQGEFAVALRSALVSGEDAWLYAGCGIMADSDPESEFDESCLKLRPMLSALGALGR